MTGSAAAGAGPPSFRSTATAAPASASATSAASSTRDTPWNLAQARARAPGGPSGAPKPPPWWKAGLRPKGPPMNRRILGREGLEVSVMGLGCMGMSEFYGAADEDEAGRTIH